MTVSPCGLSVLIVALDISSSSQGAHWCNFRHHPHSKEHAILLCVEYLTRHIAVSVFMLLVPDVSSTPPFLQMLGQCVCMNSLSVPQRLWEALPEHLRVNWRLLSKPSVWHWLYNLQRLYKRLLTSKVLTVQRGSSIGEFRGPFRKTNKEN